MATSRSTRPWWCRISAASCYGQETSGSGQVEPLGSAGLLPYPATGSFLEGAPGLPGHLAGPGFSAKTTNCAVGQSRPALQGWSLG